MAPLLLAIVERRTEPLSQVRLIQADAQYLDLPSESADAVFSRFGVMTFKDPVAAFANFRRILRPLVAGVPFRRTSWITCRFPRRDSSRLWMRVLSASRTPNTYAARLRRLGSARSSSDRTMKRCRAVISTR